jgi:AhpD family alkylhydroperoxidase
MMLEWNDYLKQVRKTTADLARLSPGIIRGYRELSDAGNKTNHLDPKTRELIALAVGVSRQCDGCIAVHAELALKHSATQEEIAETLGVTISVNAGAALVFSTRALDAVGALRVEGQKPEAGAVS